MSVTVIIPAHNEAASVTSVLRAASGSPATGQLVVVADACTDGTAEVARSFGAQVLEIEAGDKGTAMATGLAAADHHDSLFLDADLEGLRPEHVTALATAAPAPGMVVGIRDGFIRGAGLPPISGERRLPTAFGRSLRLAGLGYRTELAIDAAVAKAGLPHRHYRLIGVTNPSRPARHPLMWADLATFAVLHAPALIDYTMAGVVASR